MASLTATRVKSATLSSTTVDTVTLGPCAEVEVWNRTGANDMSFTVGAAPSAPTDKGDECFVVAAGQAVRVPTGVYNASVVVKIIGSGNGYTVTGIG
jgi:hypothetical protein